MLQRVDDCTVLDIGWQVRGFYLPDSDFWPSASTYHKLIRMETASKPKQGRNSTEIQQDVAEDGLSTGMQRFSECRTDNKVARSQRQIRSIIP